VRVLSLCCFAQHRGTTEHYSVLMNTVTATANATAIANVTVVIVHFVVGTVHTLYTDAANTKESCAGDECSCYSCYCCCC
jgi:hypothetical protein